MCPFSMNGVGMMLWSLSVFFSLLRLPFYASVAGGLSLARFIIIGPL